MPCKSTPASMNIHPTAVVVTLAVDNARVSFEYLSVAAMTCWLSVVALCSRLKISVTTNFKGPDAEKSCKCRLCLSVVPGLAQIWQLFTVLFT